MKAKLSLLFSLSLFLVTGPVFAAEAKYKPFVLASVSQESLEATQAKVKSALAVAGFELVGEAAPYPGVTLEVFSNQGLKELAAKSNMGAFGAMVRVALAQTSEGLQVSYTNPVYWGHAYQMTGDFGPVAAKLEAALGKVKEFGPEQGLTAEDLRGYHYKMMMPYFKDLDLLADYPSQEEALAAVEAGLAKKAGGVSKVYRIDLPGKAESVFGVLMTQKLSSDAAIMKEIDFKPTKSAAHLPYELVVSGGKVYALSAKFRIAISFPDLSMMGANSFMKIMDAPDDINGALKAVAGGH
ncbi:MAG: hypothetical protein A2600_09490 [Candidatus Lambdaproteobacteria bacterium RIFOXYD1_FULL_56_27]|uniref:DUF302 domain-containing protein n=1 Tax=Candidatus Lambdaproteobacteria bacterium RIFOXYD2_FULL_56_26 TaxID=1817773 RepID=A0A1F6GUN8_9PROT|nr:MAG: hypothetical protein A2557_04760 [Candidatus Lambdaproteobacteria bacterium RIFOXYD2_FULL_56_26]OGH02282.1 MAG: hypothetical protein A2426_03240 [Candidatus Lambdaproteobacteria bacterium RIFOXYC1_FULL_56_13]OGH10051.1 MAG: hypothetical protein A2600_09490 [Candidatus Lambdaproteobacteria bacterium RIFOXYD1_FULL_56_27]